ncbi:DUF262 domain-containing protein [Parablautia intestinalis]|uniref:DUF262 domain-containing protein n=1 Tax=Parablautia intestinalis TaxID=2320100 RepID=UPI00259CE4E4|nr:DUF262 domain-containing protein [Parablautia intestinalis]
MKIRKQTYSLCQYLKQLKNETIRTDQDCQRLSGQWNANMVGELIATVLTGNYIPPIILGEETMNGITKSWIIDGLQRSSSLSLFRYGNTRITKTVEENLITYQRKSLDGNGNPKRDAKGEIIWETATFDIRNKTYNQLPEELKDRFDEYQIEVVIHQDCDMSEISKLVRKFNNHTAMNTNQKAFTYIDNFAADIRRVTENKFFLDTYSGNARAKINGTYERIIADMVLLCNYPDEYRKESKKNFEWLNENSNIYDFESLDKLLTKLTDSLETTKEVKALFDVKHTHILIAAFKTFVESGHEGKEFGNFLNWFVNDGSKMSVGGKTWDDLNNTGRSTRDVYIVHGKLHYLVALIEQYFKEIQKAA